MILYLWYHYLCLAKLAWQKSMPSPRILLTTETEMRGRVPINFCGFLISPCVPNCLCFTTTWIAPRDKVKLPSVTLSSLIYSEDILFPQEISHPFMSRTTLEIGKGTKKTSKHVVTMMKYSIISPICRICQKDCWTLELFPEHILEKEYFPEHKAI